MAVTNADIRDLWEKSIQAQTNATQMFTATVDRFIEHDRENHREFREALTRLQAEQEHHGDFIRQARFILVAALILPILTEIIGFFINAGG